MKDKTEEKHPKERMIELSVQMNETMNYNICIPAVITSQTFPEILKRIKNVLSIIPKKELLSHKKGTMNPLMSLGLQESKELFKIYKTTEDKSGFLQHLSSEYKIEQDNWNNIVAMMGRVKNRIKKLEDEQ